MRESFLNSLKNMKQRTNSDAFSSDSQSSEWIIVITNNRSINVRKKLSLTSPMSILKIFFSDVRLLLRGEYLLKFIELFVNKSEIGTLLRILCYNDDATSKNHQSIAVNWEQIERKLTDDLRVYS